MNTILIVDDDTEILELLDKFFTRHGFQVLLANNGAAMDAVFEAQLPNIIILDVMMPGEDGLSLCRRIRADKGIPIIMLTGMGEISDRIVGLELGADDYIAKPFDARELLARVRAVLRRSGEADTPYANGALPVFVFAHWQLNIARRELRSREGVLIPLSGGEFDLLLVLVEHPQRILTRDQLLNLAHGQTHDVYDRSIDVLVSRLRRKLEPDALHAPIIRTVRNNGYLFIPRVSRL